MSVCSKSILADVSDRLIRSYFANIGSFSTNAVHARQTSEIRTLSKVAKRTSNDSLERND